MAADLDPEHAEALYYGALERGASWAALSVGERRAVAFFDMDEDGYAEQLLEMVSDEDGDVSDDDQEMSEMSRFNAWKRP